MPALVLKTIIGFISLFYGMLMLHDAAHELSYEGKKSVVICKYIQDMR